jgi:hypothetical protein
MKNKKGGSEWHGDGGKQHALTIKYIYIYNSFKKWQYKANVFLH